MADNKTTRWSMDDELNALREVSYAVQRWIDSGTAVPEDVRKAISNLREVQRRD